MRRAVLAVLAVLAIATVAGVPTAPALADQHNDTANGTPAPTPANTTTSSNGTAPDNGTRNDTDSGAGTVVDARAAEFTVRQPHYIDGDVRRESDNGTPVYVVRGGAIQLKPGNFRMTNVVDFSVRPSGDLSLDRLLGIFELRPGAAGTYTMEFVVRRERPTENGTDTVSVRYAARVRVEGGADLVHQNAAELEAVQENADRWQNFNQTIHDAGYVDPGEATDEVVQAMIVWYQANPAENPLGYLTGNFFSLLLTLALSWPAGPLVFLTIFGPPAVLAVLFKRDLLRFEFMEAEEGEVREAQARLDKQERLRDPENSRPQDVFDNQEVAWALSAAFGPDEDVLGTTNADVAASLLNQFQPANLVAGYCQLGGENGWCARERNGVMTDGGEPTAAELEVIRTPEGVDPANEADYVDLTTLSAESKALDRLDWQQILRAIDLDRCTEIPDGLDDAPAYDPTAVAQRWEVDLRHFEDEQHFADAAAELVEWLRAHTEYTDPDGTPEFNQFALGRVQKFAAYMEDIERWPLAYLRDALRVGKQRQDEADELEELVEDIRNNEPGGGGRQ